MLTSDCSSRPGGEQVYRDQTVRPSREQHTCQSDLLCGGELPPAYHQDHPVHQLEHTVSVSVTDLYLWRRSRTIHVTQVTYRLLSPSNLFLIKLYTTFQTCWWQAGPDPLVWGGHLLVQGDVLPQVQHSDPPQTERWAQSTGKFWQPSSDNVSLAALTGLPYLTSSDMVLCEVTLLGTDYKHILYQQLNTSHAGKPGNSRKTLKYLKRYFLIQFDPKKQTSYMFAFP